MNLSRIEFWLANLSRMNFWLAKNRVENKTL